MISTHLPYYVNGISLGSSETKNQQPKWNGSWIIWIRTWLTVEWTFAKTGVLLDFGILSQSNCFHHSRSRIIKYTCTSCILSINFNSRLSAHNLFQFQTGNLLLKWRGSSYCLIFTLEFYNQNGLLWHGIHLSTTGNLSTKWNGEVESFTGFIYNE